MAESAPDRRFRPLVALILVALATHACASAPLRGVSPLRIPSRAEGVTLDGYLTRPSGDGPFPAVVFLHGCGGLFVASTGAFVSRESDWAQRLAARGIVVLIIDSFTPRGIRNMCAPGTFTASIYADRAKDAYGALRWLQAQSFVRGDRVGIMGWSQGGGTLLSTVRADSVARPPDLAHDFRAAVAFYPGSCRASTFGETWTTKIPVLVLIGGADNWTPAAACRAFVDGARARGADIAIHVYPGAYHDFDWPNLPVKSLLQYRTSSSVPITGMDPVAREDALARVPDFFTTRLGR